MQNPTTPTSEFTPVVNALPRASYPRAIEIKEEDLRREDESPDQSFYSSPRFVQHIDDACIARLRQYYSKTIQDAANTEVSNSQAGSRGASVLDFCSSWTSHFADELLPHDSNHSNHGTRNTTDPSPSPNPTPILKSCIGIGMNAAELRVNKHLTSHIVRDLNDNPSLSEIKSSSLDVAVCSVSIDYMTQPVALLTEVGRVLRLGGSCHCAFSNRCFPTKVVHRWLRMSDEERRRWVGGYFWRCNEARAAAGDENWSWGRVEEVVLLEGGWGDPLFVVRATKCAAGKDCEF